MFIKIENRYINLNCVASFADIPERVEPANIPANPNDFNPIWHYEERKRPGYFEITLLTGESIKLDQKQKELVISYIQKNLAQ